MSISESVSRQPVNEELPPPDYSILLINNNVERENTTIEENVPAPAYSVSTSTVDNEMPLVPFRRAYQSFHGNLRNKVDSSRTTANDVATLLRSSIRRSVRVRTMPDTATGRLSRESLVNDAEPISNTSINLTVEPDRTESRRNNNLRCLRFDVESDTSVI